MIIRSKFVDYYDHFLSHENRDPKLVYNRKTENLDRTLGKGLGALTRSIRTIAPHCGDHAVGFVILGGKLYPVEIKTEVGKEPSFNYKDPYKAFQEKLPTKGYRWAKSLKVQPEATWAQEHPVADRLNREVAPVILFCEVHLYWPTKWEHKIVTANPRLEYIRFPMHGHQVIQEIMAKLAAQDPETVQSSDTIRAQAHGLDQTSFRREPGGPTRKRKKSTT